jgi:hypothetical protein
MYKGKCGSASVPAKCMPNNPLLWPLLWDEKPTTCYGADRKV